MRYTSFYKNKKKEQYNNTPLCFCRKCLSISIYSEDSLEFCLDCGGTDLAESGIDNWKRLFYEEYGNDYMNIPNTVFRKMVNDYE